MLNNSDMFSRVAHEQMHLASQARNKIYLTTKELSIFKKILDTCHHQKLNTEIRVAGGWVRDKLLRRESDDIDLAINNMSGENFARLVNEYLKTQGETHSSIAVIKSNPNQSKHLETAKFKIDGIEIDVNNLRTEVYAENSRIPEMQFGSAQEDSMRRDFTVNSLFYNIRTKKVEDFSGYGLSDLHDGLIRTPINPFITFKDDPLRVLRAARFAGKLGFKIAPEITLASQSHDTHNDLLRKVSRERYGIEIKKMLGYPPLFATYAFEILCYWGLRPVVFQVPETYYLDPEFCTEEDSKQSIPREKNEDKKLTISMQSSMYIMAHFLATNDLSSTHYYSLLLSAFLLPLGIYRCKLKKKKYQPLIQAIILDSLKLSGKDAKLSALLCRGAIIFRKIIEKHSKGHCVQLETGRLVRQLKDKWDLSLHLTYVQRRTHNNISYDNAPVAPTTDIPLLPLCNDLDITNYRKWIEDESKLILPKKEVWTWKPFVNGKEISKSLNIRGPSIGKIINEIMDWQIIHPTSTKKECIEWMKEKKWN